MGGVLETREVNDASRLAARHQEVENLLESLGPRPTDTRSEESARPGQGESVVEEPPRQPDMQAFNQFFRGAMTGSANDQPRVILGPGLRSLPTTTQDVRAMLGRPPPSPAPPPVSTPARKQPTFRGRHFIVGISIWAVGFALAFALSWKTNTNWNRGVFAKLSYGVGAGLHSWSYLVLWLMYIWGRHNPAKFAEKLADSVPSVS